MALCGDAAHPMMPNLGQGGCQSTEDGYRLGQELSQVQHTSEVSAALRDMVYSSPRVAAEPISPLYLPYISPASPHISPHLPQVSAALGRYSRVRVIRTAIIQGFAQLGSDLLVDFDLMMTIPILGPFFLTMTQLSMPWILRFLYTPEF